MPPGLTNVVEISAGLRWTLARLRNGDLIAWGLNGTAPTIVPAGTPNVVAMASGASFTLALNDNGTVVAGGPGAAGANAVPPSATNIVFVAAGSSHSLTIRNDGTPLVWGENSDGQTNVPPGLTNVVAMGGGFRHSLALTGELAPSFWRAPATNMAISKGRTLALFAGVIGLSPLTFQWQFNGTNLAGANEAWLFLNEMRTNQSGLYSVVVSNGYGSVSSDSQVSVVEAPPSVILSPEAQTLPVLGTTTLEVAVNGSLPLSYQWFRNGRPLAGQTNTSLLITNASTLDAGVYSVRVANDFGATFSAVARVTVPNVFAWGNSAGDKLNIPTNDAEVVGIAASTVDTLYLFRDGTVGTTRSNRLAGITNVATVAAADYHGMVLHSNGTVAAWGEPGRYFEISTSSLSNVMALSGGENHALALLSNGTVLAWGSLGVPSDLSNVVAIASGHKHALALQADGTVRKWGLGSAPPSGLTGVVSLAGGYAHSAALKEDGSVVVWSPEGFSNILNVPPTATNVVAISSRDFQILARRRDGTVVSWGTGTTADLVAPLLSNVAEVSSGTFHNVARLHPADYRPFISQTRAGETLSLTWPTELGKTYVIENSATLSPPDWATSWSLPGNGTHLNVTTNLLGTGGFFRVRVE